MSHTLQHQQARSFFVPEWQQAGFPAVRDGYQGPLNQGHHRHETWHMSPNLEANIHSLGCANGGTDASNVLGYSANGSMNRDDRLKSHVFRLNSEMDQYVVNTTRKPKPSTPVYKRSAYANNSNMSQYTVPITRSPVQSHSLPPSNQVPVATHGHTSHSVTKNHSHSHHNLNGSPSIQEEESKIIGQQYSSLHQNIASLQLPNTSSSSFQSDTIRHGHFSVHLEEYTVTANRSLSDTSYILQYGETGLLSRSLLSALDDAVSVEPPTLNITTNTTGTFYSDINSVSWPTRSVVDDSATVKGTTSRPVVQCNNLQMSRSIIQMDVPQELTVPNATLPIMTGPEDTFIGSIIVHQSMETSPSQVIELARCGSACRLIEKGKGRSDSANSPLSGPCDFPLGPSQPLTKPEPVTTRDASDLFTQGDTTPRIKLARRITKSSRSDEPPYPFGGEEDLETTTKIPFKVGRGTLSFNRRATRGTGKKIPKATVKATAERFRPSLSVKLPSQTPTRVVITDEVAEKLKPYVQDRRQTAHSASIKPQPHQSAPSAESSFEDKNWSDADDEDSTEDA